LTHLKGICVAVGLSIAALNRMIADAVKGLKARPGKAH